MIPAMKLIYAIFVMAVFLLNPRAVMAETRPLIAIVIDDMGVDQKRSDRAVKNLPSGVTFAYLPYARHIQKQVDTAKQQGHEIILHLPWEADNEKSYPGVDFLSIEMPLNKLRENLKNNLDGFQGYVGVNNHMGSKFSRDKAGLEIVMQELKSRNVFFLDSKTTPKSIAEKIATQHGVRTTHRDVFIDHTETAKAVNKALKEIEAGALRRGSAIAIGHPKDLTLSALESWLPTLEAKGFELVPLSAVLQYREEKQHAK
jgi:polysaccharide deacetylase 2 family uncharacterized protein YibQ